MVCSMLHQSDEPAPQAAVSIHLSPHMHADDFCRVHRSSRRILVEPRSTYGKPLTALPQVLEPAAVEAKVAPTFSISSVSAPATCYSMRNPNGHLQQRPGAGEHIY